MLTKDDFIQKAYATIDSYPTIATLQKTGDPRILQGIEAMATMLAMFSAQVETASAEVFDKTRPATIIADAAMKGVLQKAVSGRVSILAFNKNNTAYTVNIGRIILDSVGNYYRVETSVIIQPNSSAAFEALQVVTETIQHTVSGSIPYYPIYIPEASDGTFLSGISVSDSIGAYTYKEKYVNTAIGDRVFNVEADDKQNLYVRFGHEGIVGTQPADGTVITLDIARTAGVVELESGSPFSFDTLVGIDAGVELTLNSLLITGKKPPDIQTLKDFSRYPSVYDNSAVFLGEFEFLVRRKYSDTQFLSVWNETTEEAARGASVNNINKLFVACLSVDGTEVTLTEPNPNTPVTPTEIIDANLTLTQQGIKSVILEADNSYKVKFFTPVRSEITMTVAATISTSYVATDVKAKIEAAILAEYGESASASKKGGNKPLYKRTYTLLKDSVPALADVNADIQVTIADPVGNFRPEMWRYVSAASLTVTVVVKNISSPSW